jgi:uracil-DNA glycosylase family 4
MSDKLEEINKVREEILALRSSPLFSYRQENNYHPVIGEGSLDASIILIGEAPGKSEAKTGKPFCGRAGKVLDELLGSVGIDRLEVYVTNIVNDRPPENRDPTLSEIELYAPFLDRQIEIIKPRVIATLGRHSMNYIMARYGLEGELLSIGDLHGKVFETQVDGVKVKFVPLYHPAAAIYNQKLKATLLEDFQILKTLV